MKKFLLYLLRWQLSTIVIAPCVYLLTDYGATIGTIVGNFIGGIIFFWVDKWIFKPKHHRQFEYKEADVNYLNVEDTIDVLNQEGINGWELCEIKAGMLILKRKVI